jgi:hypothetical protein
MRTAPKIGDPAPPGVAASDHAEVCAVDPDERSITKEFREG